MRSLSYGPALAAACQWASDPRFPSSLPSKPGLWLLPRRASPAERARLGTSRTGAAVGSGGLARWSASGSHNHVSSPRQTQHAVFPHYAFLPASRQGLCGLFAFAFQRLRSCSSIGAFLISPLPPRRQSRYDSRAASLHRRYPASQGDPLCQPSGGCRRFLNGARRASPVGDVLVTVPIATTPPECRSAQPVCGHAAFVQGDSASGPIEATCAFTLVRSGNSPRVNGPDPRFPSSLPPNYALALTPAGYPPLNAIVAGRTVLNEVLRCHAPGEQHLLVRAITTSVHVPAGRPRYNCWSSVSIGVRLIT